MTKLSFGENLRITRKEKKLTVQAVADACGVSRSYITLIENNKRLPGKKIISKIAAALGLKTVVTLNWYLEDLSYKIQKDLDE
jgi:transcriptional regulator with XRE-family HTH domain